MECAYERLRCSERGRGGQALASGVGLRKRRSQRGLRDLLEAARPHHHLQASRRIPPSLSA